MAVVTAKIRVRHRRRRLVFLLARTALPLAAVLSRSAAIWLANRLLRLLVTEIYVNGRWIETIRWSDRLLVLPE